MYSKEKRREQGGGGGGKRKGKKEEKKGHKKEEDAHINKVASVKMVVGSRYGGTISRQPFAALIYQGNGTPHFKASAGI